MYRALVFILALGSFTATVASEPPCSQLLDTTFQEAIMRKHRIPDAHEWLWYGVPLSETDRKKMVLWFGEIIKGNENEIHDLVHYLSREPHKVSNGMDSMRFYKHPEYVELVRWIFDTYVQHPDSFVQPEDEEVDRVYVNFYEYSEQRAAIGFDEALDVEAMCFAAADAAGYFFWRNQFGYVQKHMAVLDRYGCAEDFTGFVTGEPQPLLRAIELLKEAGSVPADYQ